VQGIVEPIFVGYSVNQLLIGIGTSSYRCSIPWKYSDYEEDDHDDPKDRE